MATDVEACTCAASAVFHAYVIFDDTVLDKNFSHQIELVQRQFSGNTHSLIKGIDLVNSMYVKSVQKVCKKCASSVTTPAALCAFSSD